MKRVAIYLLLLMLPGSIFGQSEPDSVKHTTREFSLSEDYSEIVSLEIDTLISGFYSHRAIEKITPFYINLGNYGLAVVETDFFRRPANQDEFLYRHYKPYMHHPGNKRFVNTQVPFSVLDFTYGSPRPTAEQTFGVRHSQNVSRYLNFGLDLDVIFSLGRYVFQKSDNKAFTLHGSYTGKKYELLAAWSLNNFLSGENGGINDMSELSQFEPRNVPVNLGDLNRAETTFRNRNILLVQRYTLGGTPRAGRDTASAGEKGQGVRGTFSHILNWETNRKSYSDRYPGSGFYDTAYITNSATNNHPTFDSLYSRLLRNTIRFDFNTSEYAKFRLGIGIGIMNEMNLYSQIVPTYDTLFADTVRFKNSSNGITGKLYNRIGEKFGWEAFGKLWFSGYRSGDLELSGRIFKSFGKGTAPPSIYATGGVINSSPSWWLDHWGSNHFAWENDLGKEFRVNVGGGLKIPRYHFDASMDYSLVTNYVYFNSEAIPAQLGASMSVIAIRVNKLFSFWKFRSDNKILVQKSSHPDILDLPAASIRSSIYFDHLFHFEVTGGRLGFQIGAEVTYNTPFHSYNYMPATGLYYNQSDILSGNYPYLTGFANFKLKRTRIFVSFEHLNHGLMGWDYYTVPSYPMAGRVFKYGFSWTFYN